MDSKKRTQQWSDLTDKVHLIAEYAAKPSPTAEDLRTLAELATEADEMLHELREDDERQKDAPGGNVLPFRPSNGPNPTDQGSQ